MIFDPLINAEPCIELKTVILINGTAIKSRPLSLHLLMDDPTETFLKQAIKNNYETSFEF